MPVHILAALLLIQLSANAPGRATGAHVGDLPEAPDLDLAIWKVNQWTEDLSSLSSDGFLF